MKYETKLKLERLFFGWGYLLTAYHAARRNLTGKRLLEAATIGLRPGETLLDMNEEQEALDFKARCCFIDAKVYLESIPAEHRDWAFQKLADWGLYA